MMMFSLCTQHQGVGICLNRRSADELKALHTNVEVVVRRVHVIIGDSVPVTLRLRLLQQVAVCFANRRAR